MPHHFGENVATAMPKALFLDGYQFNYSRSRVEKNESLTFQERNDAICINNTLCSHFQILGPAVVADFNAHINIETRPFRRVTVVREYKR